MGPCWCVLRDGRAGDGVVSKDESCRDPRRYSCAIQIAWSNCLVVPFACRTVSYMSLFQAPCSRCLLCISDVAVLLLMVQVAARGVEALMRGDRTVVPGWQNKLYVHVLAPVVSNRACKWRKSMTPLEVL